MVKLMVTMAHAAKTADHSKAVYNIQICCYPSLAFLRASVVKLLRGFAPLDSRGRLSLRERFLC